MAVNKRVVSNFLFKIAITELTITAFEYAVGNLIHKQVPEMLSFRYQNQQWRGYP